MQLSTIAASAIVLFVAVTGDLAQATASAEAHAPAVVAAAHAPLKVRHHPVAHGQRIDPFVVSH